MSQIEKISNLFVTAGLALAGGSFFLKNFFFTVDAGNSLKKGERAIMFDKARGGISDKIIGEGMHFYIPGLQSPIKYEVRLQAKTIASHTGTKDL